MSEIRHLRLFLSSPGDVAQERLIAQDVIEQLHYDPSLRGKIFIEVVAWDKPGSDTPMLATMTPQEAINQGLPKPSDCDIVIVIFWARMGTPLPAEYVKPLAHQWADPGEMPAERYLSGTEWEFVDAFEGAVEDGLPLLVAYRRTEDVALKPKDPEFMKKLLQWQRVETFFENFSNPDGSIRQGYNTYEQPEDFRKKFETHLRKLLTKLLEETPKPKSEVKSPLVSLWQGSPFPGLRAFENTDAPIFFGRGKETDDLIERLSHQRFVAVVGASGSGKSSLVWAGVIPHLEANAISSEHTGSKDWRWLRFTPGEVGDNPFMALAVKLDRYIPGMESRVIAEKLAADPDSLNELAATALRDKPIWAELLLFIDQFEELVTLVIPTYRIAFADMLCAAVKGKQVRVVITLRADFYHQIIPLSNRLVELLQKSSYPLGVPDAIALYEMIAKPAERAGLHFESELAREILRDTGTEPGSLALLAYLLDELYQFRTNDGLLSAAAYDNLGRVQGAIGRRAEAVFDALMLANKENILHRVFHELVEVDERGIVTRRRIHFDQVNKIEKALYLVQAFLKARLLVADQDGTLEVAHEALLRNWQRLATWIEQIGDDQRLIRRIEREAYVWSERGRPEHLLRKAEILKEFVNACQRLEITIDNPILLDFIKPEQERLLEEFIGTDIDHKRQTIIDRWGEIGEDAVSAMVEAIPYAIKEFQYQGINRINKNNNDEIDGDEVDAINHYSSLAINYQSSQKLTDQITPLAKLLGRYYKISCKSIIDFVYKTRELDNISLILNYISNSSKEKREFIIRLILDVIKTSQGDIRETYISLFNSGGYSDQILFPFIHDFLVNDDKELKLIGFRIIESSILSFKSVDTVITLMEILVGDLKGEDEKFSIMASQFLNNLITRLIKQLKVNMEKYFEDIINSIYSENDEIQTNILNILDRFIYNGISIDSVFPRIEYLVSSNNSTVRIEAVNVLNSITRLDINFNGIFNILVHQLGSEDVKIRHIAVEALGYLKDKRAIPFLVNLLKDTASSMEDNPYNIVAGRIDLQAANSLAKLGDQRGIEHLSSLLGGAKSGWGATPSSVAEAMLKNLETADDK